METFDVAHHLDVSNSNRLQLSKLISNFDPPTWSLSAKVCCVSAMTLSVTESRPAKHIESVPETYISKVSLKHIESVPEAY
jgi:hypothetical protein